MKNVERAAMSGIKGLDKKMNLAYPAEIAGWSEDEKEKQRVMAAEMQKEIDAAIKNGNKSLVLKKGNYRFANSFAERLKIYNARNISLDFSGSTIWIENNGMGFLRGIEILNGENCVIKNLFLDYDPMPYFQGRITKIDKAGQNIEAKIDRGFYFPDEEWLKTSGSQMKTIFFDENGDMLKTSMNWVAPKGGIEVLDKENIRVKFRLDNLFRSPNYEELAKKACRIVIPWRRNVGIKIVECSNLTLEDITVYADPGTGVYETYGEGGTVLRRLSMIRRPETGRMLVSNADAVHSLGTKEAMHIENSRIEFAGDDLVNSNAFYAHVLSAESDFEITAATMYNHEIKKGEKLRFLEIEDWKVLGTAKVSELEEIFGEERESLLSGLKENIMHETGLTIRGERPSERVFRIKLDKGLRLKKFAIIELGGSPKGFSAKNSSFKGSIANGIRIRTANAEIEGCSIKQCHEAGVLLGGSCFWSEGAYMHDIKVCNNTFESNSRSFFSETKGELVMINEPGGENKNENYYIQSDNLKIYKNKFINPEKRAIMLSNVQNVVISDNEIICAEKEMNMGKGKILLETVKDVKCENNIADYCKKEMFEISDRAENVTVS